MTENGFYVGDMVQLPDGEKASIIEALPYRINYCISNDEFADASVVKVQLYAGLSEQYWLDIQLTRID